MNLFLQLTQRSELFSNWLKEVNFFIWQKMTQRFDFFLIWLQEPNTFLNMTQRIEHFLNMTQRIELFSKWLKEVNFLFDKIWPKGLIFSAMTQRTEHFFECDSKNWTFFFLNMIQRIEPSSQKDSKNWFFHFWFFSTIFSKIWTLFNMTHRIEPFLNSMTHWDWTLLFNMSQRKWLIFVWLKDFLLFCKMYDSKNELIVLGKYDSKNWNFWKKNWL